MNPQESSESAKRVIQPLDPNISPPKINTSNINSTRVANDTDRESLVSEAVQKIIKKRAQACLIATGIIILWTFVSLIIYTNFSVLGIALTGGVSLFLSLLFYVLNIVNYPTPRTWYRLFNKVMYMYSARIGILLNTFIIISNIIDFFNPLYGFKKPNAPSRTELFTSTVGSGVLIYGLRTSLPAAYVIEEYFEIKALNKKNPKKS